MTKKEKILLILIFFVGWLTRFYGRYWDQGFQFHPDERMIMMVTERIRLPQSLTWNHLFTVDSPLNPQFFAYGSLPIYLLKFTAWLVSLALGKEWLSYGYLPITGRWLSILFDLGTIGLVFLLAKKIFNTTVGLWSAAVYATCVFPIQMAHFYTVDTLLNFFVILTLFSLVRFYEKNSSLRALVAGLSLGLALATKVSAIVLIVPFGFALLTNFVLIFYQKIKETGGSWWKRLLLIFHRLNKKKLAKIIFTEVLVWGVVFMVVSSITFVILEPFSVIDAKNFWRQIQEQRRMTTDAYTFPYTLQYVGTIPYLYHLRNILSWGIGWSLGIVSLAGTMLYLVNLGKRLLQNQNYNQQAKELILVIFLLAYFASVGKFAVKFMRYLLPLYPLIIIYGIWLADKAKKIINTKIFSALASLLILVHLVWLIAFLHIYSLPNTRITATNWIIDNIPPESVLATEHWDDRLPITKSELFNFVEMPMYEYDSSPNKWNIVEKNLQSADYIIIASNRLYTPLTQLSDCSKYKICYPRTGAYYQNLLSEKSGFKKVAEFTSYPTIPWLNLAIIDDQADESFTVYDHPKVIIFKKDDKQ